MNPITETVEILQTKSFDQYKIIEDRYITLRMYLINYFQKHDTIDKMHLEILLNALDKESYISENQVEKEIKTEYVDQKMKDDFKVGDKVRLDKPNDCTLGFVKGGIYEITEIEDERRNWYNITISDKTDGETEGYVNKNDISKVEERKDD